MHLQLLTVSFHIIVDYNHYMQTGESFRTVTARLSNLCVLLLT